MSFLCLQEVDVHEKVDLAGLGKKRTVGHRQGYKELIESWRVSK
jgi:hypothetical protein